MEFFYAETLWSGYLRMVTNVTHLPNEAKEGNYLISVFLSAKDAAQLKQYLQGQAGTTFEQQLEFAFYFGSPVDSWFDLERFLRVCEENKLAPTVQFFSCDYVCTQRLGS